MKRLISALALSFVLTGCYETAPSMSGNESVKGSLEGASDTLLDTTENTSTLVSAGPEAPSEPGDSYTGGGYMPNPPTETHHNFPGGRIYNNIAGTCTTYSPEGDFNEARIGLEIRCSVGFIPKVSVHEPLIIPYNEDERPGAWPSPDSYLVAKCTCVPEVGVCNDPNVWQVLSERHIGCGPKLTPQPVDPNENNPSLPTPPPLPPTRPTPPLPPTPPISPTIPSFLTPAYPVAPVPMPQP